MKVGVFLTNQHPPGSDMVSALEGQYVMEDVGANFLVLRTHWSGILHPSGNAR